MVKDKGYLVIIAVILALMGGYYFLSKQVANNNSQDTQEEISESDQIINALANKYQATIEQEEKLDYTIQAQEKWITDRPVLFEGYIDDVFIREEKRFIIFDSYGTRLELECDQQIIDKFFAMEAGVESDDSILFSKYVIVANIDEVTRPLYKLEGYAYSLEEVGIEIESSSLFIAKGTCVDIAVIDRF